MSEYAYGLEGIDDEHEKSAIEQIRSCLQANLPVFLHGKPGEGKSQRVKSIDPNCRVLELSLIPIEDLTGITVVAGGKTQKVMPRWLTDFIQECEKEPKKEHILFLDELTNAVPSIQTLAYSLVLEREVAHTWKLPENVRIVAAGNEVEDSITASEMPEPLRDRFAHIQVKTSLEEWIDWAYEHHIHPLIIDFVGQTGALRREIGEYESDQQITPRTWERASKLLMESENLSLLDCVLGHEMREDIMHFFGYDEEMWRNDEYTSTNEYIQVCINANVPVFLHGKPGEGKSQRVKEIDSDCVTIELSLAPVEDLSGLVVYENGSVEKKKPEWLENLEKKCLEEPEKNHILFLDELTNATPMIQQLAYSLVLERTVGNTWKLPENVRIIAAGNEVEDSIVASEIPEPLKDRFAHVQVKTSLEEWIVWAARHKIHPSIIAYIASQGETTLRESDAEGKIVRTPRTWERASKQLTSSKNPKSMIPILGDAITEDFMEFCQNPVLTRKDVMEGFFIKEGYVDSGDVRGCMAGILGLIDVDESEIEEVRNYVKTMGFFSDISPTLLFEELWMAADELKRKDRERIIHELRQQDMVAEAPQINTTYIDDTYAGKSDDERIEQEEADELPQGLLDILNDEDYADDVEKMLERYEEEKRKKMEQEDMLDEMFDENIGKFGRRGVVRGNHKKSLRKTPKKFVKQERKRYFER